MSTTTAQEAGASPPRENLVRALGEAPTLERADGSEMPTLTGHFAVWDQWTEIRSAFEGNFMERFAPGAMNKTLAENTPKVLFQHGKDPQIGNKVLGIARSVSPDAYGAAYTVPLFDTSYNRDLIPGLDAGAYGSSFRFAILQDELDKKPARSEYNPRGIPERTVTEAKVAEFGPVTFPQYVKATAGLRSLTDEFLMERLLEDEEMVERLAQRVSDKQRVSVYFGGGPSVGFEGLGAAIAGASANLPGAAERLDSEDLSTLACMLQSGAQYIADQDEPEDQANVPKMEAILASIAALVPAEVAEDEPPEPDEMNAQPESPGATTAAEPEPSEATTRSVADLCWFADTSRLKGAK